MLILLYTKFKNGSEFGMWFGRRRKVKGLKYVSIFQKRGALSSRNEISNSVRQQLTREVAKDIVRSYSLEKRASRFSRSTRDEVRLLVTFFFFFVALICIAALSKITEATAAQQEFIDDAKIYALVVCCRNLDNVAIAGDHGFKSCSRRIQKYD